MKDLTLIFGPSTENLSAEEAARRSSRVFVRSEGQLAVYEASDNRRGINSRHGKLTPLMEPLSLKRQ